MGTKYNFVEFPCPKCGEPKDLEGIYEDNHQPSKFTISCDICDHDIGYVEAGVKVEFNVVTSKEP